MKETIIDNVQEAAVVAEETVKKPYEFRLLGAPDIFLMSRIISKIGIKEFKAIFEGEGIKNMIQNAFLAKTDENGGEADSTDFISAGAGIVLDLASVILANLPNCEKEIYSLLAQTSNLSVDEIKAPGNAAMFVEMVIDFIKKEEFGDFIRVVSKLFK